MLGIYGHDTKNGPGKVFNNLISGLKILNIPFKINCEGFYNISLIGNNIPLQHSLIGPNCFVLPSERIDLVNCYEHFVCPSLWVKDLYGQCMKKNVYIWPSGIDVESFEMKKEIHNDCLIYFKNRRQEELFLVEQYLLKRNIKYDIIRYGAYNEVDFKDKLRRSKFVLMLNNTESQGIATMEIMASNTPMYVLDKTVWTYRQDENVTFAATSVPYFSSDCGVVGDWFEDFEMFLDNIETYSPIKYVSNYSLENGAKMLINIFKEVYNGS
jgi:glycosyltransferase involved in cell wall biosynthesis